jgi:hypothetical protein
VQGRGDAGSVEVLKQFGPEPLGSGPLFLGGIETTTKQGIAEDEGTPPHSRTILCTVYAVFTRHALFPWRLYHLAVPYELSLFWPLNSPGSKSPAITIIQKSHSTPLIIHESAGGKLTASELTPLRLCWSTNYARPFHKTLARDTHENFPPTIINNER